MEEVAVRPHQLSSLSSHPVTRSRLVDFSRSTFCVRLPRLPCKSTINATPDPGYHQGRKTLMPVPISGAHARLDVVPDSQNDRVTGRADGVDGFAHLVCCGGEDRADFSPEGADYCCELG